MFNSDVLAIHRRGWATGRYW